MKYEIKCENLPLGICIESIKGPGKVKLLMTDFTSSEDGALFVDRLEGFPNYLLRTAIPDQSKFSPALVHSMLAIIRRDCSATLYLNDFPISALVQMGRSVPTGAAVYSDDIVDIKLLRFEGIDIPVDAGVLFLFSAGWRKGLYFDFSPLSPNENVNRGFNLEKVLAECYCQVQFQEMFKISDNDWENLTNEQWFPFRSLGRSLISELIKHIKSGWSPDELLSKFTDRVKSFVAEFVTLLQNDIVFQPHYLLLKTAVERYLANDYVSTTAILYPRIEGVIRSYHLAKGDTTKPTQSTMALSAVQTPGCQRLSNSLLMPQRFTHYLRKAYFADFNPSAPKIPVSRHSVSHGVASADEFNEKASTIGFLILTQLHNYFAPFSTAK